jgi:hypothetical protein
MKPPQEHIDYITEHELYLDVEKMLRYVFENHNENPLIMITYLIYFFHWDLKQGKDVAWEMRHKFKTERGDSPDSFGQGLDD